ncbi:AP-1 complex subunit sigma-3 [Thelohanellus kitauei]|uniref:AP complex subunit sigma n=1 Tax=Thelohanellus kitauei TaxID=669202 RepID=A0A0C2N161_THEKT|nr:AP-1 complex subunit sigma-3 [Thelohanellus kitauei]
MVFNTRYQLRFQKWFVPIPIQERKKMITELIRQTPHMKALDVNISLYHGDVVFLFAADLEDNELYIIELIHRWVVVMNDYFKQLCELDIMYNFEKCQFLLDELVIGGELQELDREIVVQNAQDLDRLMEDDPQGKYLRLY